MKLLNEVRERQGAKKKRMSITESLGAGLGGAAQQAANPMSNMMRRASAALFGPPALDLDPDMPRTELFHTGPRSSPRAEGGD